MQNIDSHGISQIPYNLNHFEMWSINSYGILQITCNPNHFEIQNINFTDTPQFELLLNAEY